MSQREREVQTEQPGERGRQQRLNVLVLVNNQRHLLLNGWLCLKDRGSPATLTKVVARFLAPKAA